MDAGRDPGERLHHLRRIDRLTIDAGQVEARAAQVPERAHGCRRGADLLAERVVDRDRLQRVDRRAVLVEPAAEPAGLHLVDRAAEPDVGALEVRVVGWRVVGGGEDREVRAGSAAPVAVHAVEAERGIAVVARVRGGDADVREAEAAAGATHRPGADGAAGSGPDDAGDVRPCGLVARVRRVDRNGDVESVVPALQVDDHEALLHRVRLGGGRLEHLAPVEPRRRVDGRHPDDALGEQPPAAELARRLALREARERGCRNREPLRGDRGVVGARPAPAVVAVDVRLEARVLRFFAHHITWASGPASIRVRSTCWRCWRWVGVLDGMRVAAARI